MKKYILITMLLMPACEPKPEPVINPKFHDSEVIKKLEEFTRAAKDRHVYLGFFPRVTFHDGSIWTERRWMLTLFYPNFEVEGEGLSISDAYVDAIRNKNKLCAEGK